jgi:hypothetical protein
MGLLKSVYVTFTKTGIATLTEPDFAAQNFCLILVGNFSEFPWRS